MFESAAVPTYDVPEPAHAIVLLPLYVEDGKAVYSEDLVTAKKELHASGADVEFLHAPDERVFFGQRGEDVLVQIFVQFIGGAAGNLLASWIQGRFSGRRTKITACRVTEDGHGGKVSEWFTGEGDGDDIAKALREF